MSIHEPYYIGEAYDSLGADSEMVSVSSQEESVDARFRYIDENTFFGDGQVPASTPGLTDEFEYNPNVIEAEQIVLNKARKIFGQLYEWGAITDLNGDQLPENIRRRSLIEFDWVPSPNLPVQARDKRVG